MIIAGALNFKMAALHLVDVSEEVINALDENSKLGRAREILLSLAEHFSKERCEVLAY